MRGQGARRASRKTGVVVSLSAGAAALIAVLALAAYFVGVRPDSDATGAAAAVISVPTSHTVAMLERQREQLIEMSVASKSLKIVGKPRLASRRAISLQPVNGPGSSPVRGPSPVGVASAPDPGTAESTAWHMMSAYGWNPQTYFSCLNDIWTRESGWRYNAENPSGAYGIPQALPGSKMASAGADWQTDPATQIRWGLSYIQGTYGDPCSAWAFWQAHDYY
jgi:hypothetical protein